MGKSIFRRRLFVALFSGLFMGMLCACNGGSDQEESTIAEEEQAQEESAEREMDLESIDTGDEVSKATDALSEEEKTIYEAYLQAEYAGEDYLYAYCDFDEDGRLELYLRDKDPERNYGHVMKFTQGGLTFAGSGEVSEAYIKELSWSEVPQEAPDGREEMTHEGVYVFADQNTDTREFWYSDEQAFLEQYGLFDEEPFYEYMMLDGTQRLKFYYNEETQFGCGIDYYKRDPSDMMTSGACGFTFQGLKEELVYGDGLSVDYGRFESVYGDVFSGQEGYEETIEYEGVSGQVSHYEVSGVIEEGEEPQLLLWMDYQYYPDGKLKERFYYHNSRMFGTSNTTWESYFDTQGRLEHEYIYITHGWLEYYYIYEDESKTPAYCLQLDNDGWFRPEFVKCHEK